jgi:mannose-6-phosphate isomerase-like protein (cupin superfamily)
MTVWKFSKKEDSMTTAVRDAQVFRYESREIDRGKSTTWLCRSDILSGMVQVVKDGGETNLHAHPNNDGFWMVLSGRARFYGEGDVLLADLGKFEGILIPRGFQYWFESASEEPLEILRVGAIDPNARGERIDYTPLTKGTMESKHFSPAAPERVGAAAVSRPPDGWER